MSLTGAGRPFCLGGPSFFSFFSPFFFFFPPGGAGEEGREKPGWRLA